MNILSLERLATLRMPPALLRAQTWFDGMESQKRMMLLAIALLFLAMVWQNLLWLPHEQSMLRLQATVAATNKSLPALKTRLQKIPTEKKVDLNAERTAQIQAMESELHTLSTTLNKESGTLIQPSDMLQALRRLLAERPEVTVRRLEASTVKPVPLSLPGTAAKSPDKGNATKPSDKGKATKPPDKAATSKPPVGEGEAPVIYRHDIELEIGAEYLDVLAFFKEVEGYPWAFFWDEVRYRAVDYPATEIVIRLFTLSMGEGLIGG